MKKLILVVTGIAVIFIWYGFQGERINAKTDFENSTNLPPTNLTGANLTGAKLEGVNLDGVILCNTTMPDGSINNSNCQN